MLEAHSGESRLVAMLVIVVVERRRLGYNRVSNGRMAIKYTKHYQQAFLFSSLLPFQLLRPYETKRCNKDLCCGSIVAIQLSLVSVAHTLGPHVYPVIVHCTCCCRSIHLLLTDINHDIMLLSP